MPNRVNAAAMNANCVVSDDDAERLGTEAAGQDHLRREGGHGADRRPSDVLAVWPTIVR